MWSEPPHGRGYRESVTSVKKIFPGIMSMRAPKIAWGGLPIRVGVIGGSGLYKLDGIEIIDVVNPETVRQVKRRV